jgi:hypothetical protein
MREKWALTCIDAALTTALEGVGSYTWITFWRLEN